jgi:prepilin-type N-terminal cleavage/methylation domain-containing protein
MRQAPIQRRQRFERPRGGFTLIELLVVMAIIAILVGLTAAAAFRVRIKALEVQTRNDISQLSTSVQAFQTKNQVDFIPSRIRLRNNVTAYNTSSPYEMASFTYLKKIWPRLNNNGQMVTDIANGTSKGWMPDDPNCATPAGCIQQVYDLEGDQCLVFFLGGLQASGSCRGFPTNKADPTNLSGQFDSPIYDYPTARLTNTLVAATAVRSQLPLTFVDPYGSPYAYFSSWAGIGYNYIPSSDPVFNNGGNPIFDCDGLQAKFNQVRPYYEGLSAGTKFYNRDGFQIISAGRDQLFGPGGNPTPGGVPTPVWDARTGYDGAVGGVGDDDLSNFHPVVLGAKL